MELYSLAFHIFPSSFFSKRPKIENTRLAESRVINPISRNIRIYIYIWRIKNARLHRRAKSMSLWRGKKRPAYNSTVPADVRHRRNAHHGESHGACISFLQLDAIEVTTARGSKTSNAKGLITYASNLSSCRSFAKFVRTKFVTSTA